MDEVMQVPYNDILQRLLVKYYGKTDFEECCEARDKLHSRLHAQLSPSQQALLRELQQASDLAHAAELEAMFLTAFDLCKSLALPHSA